MKRYVDSCHFKGFPKPDFSVCHFQESQIIENNAVEKATLFHSLRTSCEKSDMLSRWDESEIPHDSPRL